PLIEDVDFFVGDIERGRVNHAIMGAVAGHPILERALDEIRPREFYGYDKSATGPLFFDRVLKGFPDAKVFEQRYFYEKGETARQDGYALHHDANSWKSPEQLRSQAEKERARALKKRDEARRWRRRYEEAEAKLAR